MFLIPSAFKGSTRALAISVKENDEWMMAYLRQGDDFVLSLLGRKETTGREYIHNHIVDTSLAGKLMNCRGMQTSRE